jgi:transcriptional regulator with XRE-family HTH domain
VTDDANTFADRLRKLRERSGMSQYALAKRSGISKQSISNFELGNREPSWVTVQRLVLALEANFEDLTDPDIELPEVHPGKRGRARPKPQTEPAPPRPPRPPRAGE